MEGEGDAGRPSAAPEDYSSTPFPPAPRSSSSPDVSPVAPWVDLDQCAMWTEVRDFLRLCQVPDAQLPYWDALWRWECMTSEVNSTVLDQLVTEFCQRVQDTREDYQCFIPEREGRRGELCLKVVRRRERMKSHICSDHLGGVREFQCLGQCGRVECRETFLQQRYLRQHVNPKKVQCLHCAKQIYKRNMSTHRC